MNFQILHLPLSSLLQSMRYPLRSRTPISGMKRLGLYVPPPQVRRNDSDCLPIPTRRQTSSSTNLMRFVFPPFRSPKTLFAFCFCHLQCPDPFHPFPSQRAAEAAKRASMSYTSFPVPRVFGGSENETPKVVAFNLPEPKPYASFGGKRKSLNSLPSSLVNGVNGEPPALKPISKPEPLAVLCRDAAATRKGNSAVESERIKPTRVSATRRGSRSRGGRGRVGVKVVIVPPRH